MKNSTGFIVGSNTPIPSSESFVYQKMSSQLNKDHCLNPGHQCYHCDCNILINFLGIVWIAWLHSLFLSLHFFSKSEGETKLNNSLSLIVKRRNKCININDIINYTWLRKIYQNLFFTTLKISEYILTNQVAKDR